MPENVLGPWAVYYIDIGGGKWSQVSNYDKIPINEFKEEFKTIDGIRCKKATINGSAPMEAWIPFIKN